MIIFGIDIRIYFLLFLIYAFIGWCLEVVGKLITLKKFINRGFLIGPICPIYGVGAILITFLLKKFNINGRVCLNTIIPFGILGMFIMYVSNPFLLQILESIPEILLNILSSILLIIFIIDNIVSTNIISYVGKTTKEIGKDLDNTEEITKKVKEILLGKSGLYRRLLKAYPTIQSIKVKIKEKQKEIKKQVEDQKNEIIENIAKQKKEIKEKIDNLKEN